MLARIRRLGRNPAVILLIAGGGLLAWLATVSPILQTAQGVFRPHKEPSWGVAIHLDTARFVGDSMHLPMTLLNTNDAPWVLTGVAFVDASDEEAARLTWFIGDSERHLLPSGKHVSMQASTRTVNLFGPLSCGDAVDLRIVVGFLDGSMRRIESPAIRVLRVDPKVPGFSYEIGIGAIYPPSRVTHYTTNFGRRGVPGGSIRLEDFYCGNRPWQRQAYLESRGDAPL